METLQGLPIIFFAGAGDWHKWLHEHYGQESGIWIKFGKKSAGVATLTYNEALDEALCYGWIDGQTKSLGAQYYLQKFTPRRPKSIWSKRNVAKVGELIASGRMRAPGLAQVEAAKQDGRWQQAYDSPRNMATPPDFLAALQASPKAQAFFEGLNKSNKYAVLWRIQTAKKPQTRQVRINSLIQMLEEGRAFH